MTTTVYKVPQTPKRVSLDPDVGGTLVTKNVTFTASQTGTTVWQPTTGKRFIVTDFAVNFTAAGKLTLFDGTDGATTRMLVFTGPANGGVSHSCRKPFLSSAVNNILKYTTGTGAAGEIVVWGYED